MTRRLTEHWRLYGGALKTRRGIVLTNGTFDIFHPGHVYALEFAASHGSILIVSVDADEQVEAVRGTPPAMSWWDRAILVASQIGVTFVTSHGHAGRTPGLWADADGATNLAALIRLVHPTVWVARSEDLPDDEVEAARSVGAKIVRIPRIGSWASSEIKRSISETHPETP